MIVATLIAHRVSIYD